MGYYFQQSPEGYRMIWNSFAVTVILFNVIILKNIYIQQNEILVVAVTPKFDKAPNLTKFLQEMLKSLVRSCKSVITCLKVSFRSFTAHGSSLQDLR